MGRYQKTGSWEIPALALGRPIPLPLGMEMKIDLIDQNNAFTLEWIITRRIRDGQSTR
jgi:hypothetical protein